MPQNAAPIVALNEEVALTDTNRVLAPVDGRRIETITDQDALPLHEAVTGVEMIMEEMSLVVIVSDLAVVHVPHTMATEITDREVQVLDRLRLLKTRHSVFPNAMPEIYQTFKSSSWKNWTVNLYHGLRMRCAD